MSDPVKNEEIEDVLSSIRRLVSESGGTKTDVKAVAEQLIAAAEAEPKEPEPEEPAAEAKSEASDQMDALVLTPSLRVADAPDESHEQAEKDPEHVEAEEVHDGQAVSEGETGEAQEHPSPEAEMDDHGSGEPHSEGERAATKEVHHDDEDDGEGASHDYTDQDVQGKRDEEARQSFQERIAKLEEAVATETGEWDDEPEDSAYQWEDSTEAENAAFTPNINAEEAEFEDIVAEPEQDEKLSPSDVNAEAETTAAESEAPAQSEAEETFDFLADGADDALLDEEALREMVADIVRQELQGALGERITRNVRKLVRREIHRALMAQELE